MNTLLAVLCLLFGVLIGAGVTWLAMHGTRREWEQTLEAALPRVAEAVLRPKTEQLERTSELELKLLGADTVYQVEKSQSGMQAKLEEALKQLAGYQERINAFERERASAQATLEQQLQQVAGAGAQMAQEARTLRQALATSSGVRGAWGEAVLKNILDASGLNEQIDYDLQPVLEGSGGLRPDAVIYLPGGSRLAVDAKASLSAFLAGLEASEDGGRLAAYAEFAQVLRRRAKELAGKDYCRHLARSLPFVVMFVPSESAFRAALDSDRELFLDGQKLHPPVMLASPSTLFPLMAVIHQSWDQQKASEKMQEMLVGAAELGKRLKVFVEHLQRVGQAIDDAGKAYDAAGASFRSRLEPQLRRLRDMNAGWPALDAPKAIEHRPALAEVAANSEE